jgi:hypothetical protein
MNDLSSNAALEGAVAALRRPKSEPVTLRYYAEKLVALRKLFFSFSRLYKNLPKFEEGGEDVKVPVYSPGGRLGICNPI